MKKINKFISLVLATLMLLGCFSVAAFADDLAKPVMYQELRDGEVKISEPILNYHYHGKDEASNVPEYDRWEIELYLDNNFARFGANTEPVRIKDAEGNVVYSFVPTADMVIFYDEVYAQNEQDTDYHGCVLGFSCYAYENEIPMDTFTIGETYTIILPEDTFRLVDGTSNAEGRFTVTVTSTHDNHISIFWTVYFFNRIVIFFRDLFSNFVALFQ